MKKFRKLLAFALVLAIMASFAVVSASAEDCWVDYISPNKDGTWTFRVCLDTYNLQKVTCGSKTLTAGTDYVLTESGDFWDITLQTSFTKATKVSDFTDIKFYYTSDDYVKFSKSESYGSWSGTTFWEKMAVENFNSEYYYLGGVLDFFVEKGIITVSENAGVKTYKNGNLDLFYMDSEYVYPADADVAENLVKCENINLYDIKYMYDRFVYCQGIPEYYDEYIAGINYFLSLEFYVATFGNRCLVDFSGCEAGEVPLESAEVSQIKALAIENLSSSGKLVIEYPTESYTYSVVKNADATKQLLTTSMVGNDSAVQFTLSDGLTADDNVFFTDEDGFTYALVFESPKIISGDNSKWNHEEKGDMTISSDANFEDFLCIYVDDGTVPADAYTVVEGSTVVTLKEAYLSTLAAGTHTLDIVSKSGIATATFTIAEKPEAPKKEEPKEEIANTADNSAIGAFVALSVIGAAGFVSMKKKED